MVSPYKTKPTKVFAFFSKLGTLVPKKSGLCVNGGFVLSGVMVDSRATKGRTGNRLPEASVMQFALVLVAIGLAALVLAYARWGKL